MLTLNPLSPPAPLSKVQEAILYCEALSIGLVDETEEVEVRLCEVPQIGHGSRGGEVSSSVYG